MSEDGGTVLGVDRLLQCLVQPVSSATGAFSVFTPLADTPNEGHVFTAMSNGLPLYLGTWKSEPGRMWLIRRMGP